MKKIFVLCLAISVLLSVFVGCEQTNANPNDTSSEIGQESDQTRDNKTDDITENTESGSMEETNTSESTSSSDCETNSSENPSETNQESENTYEEETNDITESTENSSAEETNTSESTSNPDLNASESECLSESGQKNENTSETEDASEQQENDKSNDNSIQTNQYQFFHESVEENPYDKWLKNELGRGERAEKTIYAEYLAFWKDELVFTIESGEVIFDDKEQYEQWKSDMQQWLVISQDILKNEMNMMNYSLGQLEVIIPYCEMVRQKVIDAKRFIYYYQIYNTLTPYTNIEINWCVQ